MITLPVPIVRRLVEIARQAGVKVGIDLVGPFDDAVVRLAEEQVARHSASDSVEPVR